MDLFKPHYPSLIAIAESAAEKIRSFYLGNSQLKVVEKSDQSPVTSADHASHDVIVPSLQSFILGSQSYPVISEEDPIAQSLPSSYWCVDPLDGTKEFIQQTDEFCINIAFIEQGEAILGLVYDPLRQTAYIASKGEGAYKIQAQQSEPICCTSIAQPMRILSSRSHRSAKMNAFLTQHGEAIQTIFQGSALKFANIAMGKADCFLRSKGSSEWDNAAGHCLLKEAGGNVFSLPDHLELTYGTQSKQSALYAVGDVSFSWPTFLNATQ